MTDREWITYVEHAYPEHHVDLGEVTMNWAETGDPDAPTLLLLPGQSESWWGYERAMGLLAESFHVVAVDLRGQGRTSWTPGRYTYDLMGGDLVRFIGAVLDGPVLVAGNSSGGMLAAWLSAYAMPGQIRGAVLEDPPLFSSEIAPLYGPSQRQSAGPVLELWAEWIGDQWERHDWDGFLAAARTSPSPLARMMGMFAEVPQTFKEYDPEWSRAFLEGTMAGAVRTEDLLAHVRTPILLTHHGRAIDPATGILIGALGEFQGEKAQEIIAATGVPFTYCSFPDAQHQMHAIEPERYVAVVTEWAAGLD